MIFLGRFFLFFSECGVYVVFSLNPLFSSALSYWGFALLKTSSELEISDKRLLIMLGSCRRIDGGWFDWWCMYWGVSLGFLYG